MKRNDRAVAESTLKRRPIASRSAGWAIWLAGRLVAGAVTPNQISVASVAFAAIGAGLMLEGGWPFFLGAALCIQFRLVCNLLDGMVAVEGGKATASGEVFNEFPDRIADSLLLVALGYAAGLPWLGWLAALLAALTAYVRVFGGAVGLALDFGGVMAKQIRMALLTAGLAAAGVELTVFGSVYALAATAAIIAAGCGLTCWTRTRKIMEALES